MEIKVQRLHPDAVLPRRASFGAAGYDLTAIGVENPRPDIWVYDTGLSVQLPEGYEGQIRARSSIMKTDCMLANGVGTIDSDYRGPLKVVFRGPGAPYQFGDRIAQLVIAKIETPFLIFTDSELSQSERGHGGFGSTGK